MKTYNITRFKEALAALTPDERLYMAQFVAHEDACDEGMNCEDVYQTLEYADVCSDDGKPEVIKINLGMCLPPVKIEVYFKKDGAGFVIGRYEVLEDR